MLISQFPTTGSAVLIRLGLVIMKNAHSPLLVCLLLCSAQVFAQAQDLPEQPSWLNYYQQDLSEQLLDDGFAALENFDLGAAEDKATQAMQIIKVNYGLNSELQFPALELLVESLLAQQRWQAVEQHLSYFEWLVDKTYSKDLEQFLAGTEILSQLLLTAAADTNIVNSARFLVAAKNLNWRAVSAIEGRYGKDSLRLAPCLYNITLIHFYQTALNKRNWLTSYAYKSEGSEQVSGWSLSKSESIRKSYNIGTELLQRIRSLYQQSELSSAAVEAKLLMYQADWELLFDRGNSALALYRQAYAQLQLSDLDAQQIDLVFRQTPVLPEPVFTLALPMGEATRLSFVPWSVTFPSASAPDTQRHRALFEQPQAKVVAVFSLAPRREVDPSSPPADAGLDFVIENLQLNGLESDSELLRQQLQNEIGALTFRPRFVAGNPVLAEGIELDYYFTASNPEIALD